MPLALGGLRVMGVEPRSGLPLVVLGNGVGDLAVAAGHPAAPRATVPIPGEPAAWVTLVGRIVVRDGLALEVGDDTVALDLLCADSTHLPDGVLSVTGIGLPDPPRVIVPCDGVRPAPTLARSTAAAPARPGPGSGRAAPAREEVDGGALATKLDMRRTLAAWLLALGALALSGAAIMWRRLAAVPDPDQREGADSETDLPDVPHLTLVRLRRDEGS
ncbi:MAG: hypothetical protein LC744_05050 [Chloroflexi bacterium]|nr:hypothetical protein [Chloroflexota bacterium]